MSSVDTRTSGRFRLRRMQEADLPTVIELERKSQVYPWPASYFVKVLRGDALCWVLEQGGTVRGFGIVRVARGWAHLMNICVAPGYRGYGLGRRIVRHLLVVASAHHAAHIWLEVRPTNRPALRLYRAMGFRRKQTRKGYYPARGGRQDALVMVRRV